MTLSRSEVAAQLTAAGLSPRRSLGQNFVVDPNTVRRIVRLAEVDEDDDVLEIGAGLGSLTLALADTGAAVTALEIDPSLLPLLRQNTSGCANVRVVQVDAMRADWDELLRQGDKWLLVANLPYNVATPLIADLLDHEPRITRMLVMIQREVGERLVAAPRSAAYGALSVKVSFWAEAKIVGYVPPTVFLPVPKVESVLVSIVRRPTPRAADVVPEELFALVRRGFGQRRKMLRRALSGHVDERQLRAATVDPTARAEELSVDDWVRIRRVLDSEHQ